MFVACPLRELVPDDHILKRVDAVLDLSWLPEEVRDLYDEATGRRDTVVTEAQEQELTHD